MIGLIYSFFGNPRDYAPLSPDEATLTAVFAIVGGLILTRFTSTFGSLTIPLNCAALYVGAMLSHAVFKGVRLPLDPSVEAPMMISLVGMTAASFVMLWWLQGDAMRR